MLVSVDSNKMSLTLFVYVAVRCMFCMQMTKAKLRKYS